MQFPLKSAALTLRSIETIVAFFFKLGASMIGHAKVNLKFYGQLCN
jgi:hypothetical protein